MTSQGSIPAKTVLAIKVVIVSGVWNCLQNVHGKQAFSPFTLLALQWFQAVLYGIRHHDSLYTINNTVLTQSMRYLLSKKEKLRKKYDAPPCTGTRGGLFGTTSNFSGAILTTGMRTSPTPAYCNDLLAYL